MTDTQILTIVLSAVPPTLATLIGILLNNARLNDVNNRLNDMNNRINEVGGRISSLETRMNERFNEMRATWTAELRRVEEVLDARLKHLEER